MSLIERVWRSLSHAVTGGPERCAHCGAADPRHRPGGSYMYCSAECAEADADDQADVL